MAANKYLEEAFTNEFGQVIQPGQTIIAITTGYSHNVHIRQAIYLGLRKKMYRDKEVVSEVVVRFKGTKWKYDRERGTGEHIVIERQYSLPRKRIYPSDISLSSFKHI